MIAWPIDIVTLDRVDASATARRRPSRELSLSVERGEMFGLIGPDGAGKTTTIRLICGLLRADAGRVACSAWIPSASIAG